MTETLIAPSPKFSFETKPQNTVSTECSISGIGIHTGKKVSVKLLPASEGTGIIFKRVDLPFRPEIPAHLSKVLDTSRNTTLGIGEAKVYTVEHLLSVLHAFEIDNLLIEIDGPEPPVGDGSSKHFIDAIETIGVVRQRGTKPILKLDQAIHLSDSNIHLIALPHDRLSISYTLNYPGIEAIGSQYFSIDIDKRSFKKELASCRTFALYSEVKLLRDAGLIKGGSLDNAIVIDQDKVLNPSGLRFPNEMVRHKILDILGDLKLIGIPFYAHIIAICSGHKANVALGEKLLNYFTMENN